MIIELKTILEALNSVGIEEVIIEPNDDNESSRVRAVSKDSSVVVCDDIPIVFVEYPMGIESVRGLLSRLNLFDTDKASITMTDGNDVIQDITIKMGRKKASFRCCHPKHISAPSEAPDSTKSDVITFNKEYVTYLGKAVAAMSFTGEKDKRTIALHAEDGTMSVKISDGQYDSFNEVIEDVEVETEHGVWEVSPFQRVMNKAVEYSETDEANFTIDDFGVATFSLGYFEAMIVPMAS